MSQQVASTARSRRSRQWSLGWQAALAAYMQLISWVPLGRWNRQACCPPALVALRSNALSVVDVMSLVAFVLPVVVFWYGDRRGWKWAMGIVLAGYAVWLGLQLVAWWPPYIFGASAHWARVYARAFAVSTNFLPRWSDHLPPDAMHVVLQVLLVGALATGYRALRRSAMPNPII